MQGIDETLNTFDKDLRDIFGEKYLDILIGGSIVLKDFTPHKGDIDFIVLLDGDCTEDEFFKVCELHDRYRRRESAYLEYQLEGTYYPIGILNNINSHFNGIYIGTGRKGWKLIHAVTHNSFDLIKLKQFAVSYRKVKTEIYMPSEPEIFSTVQKDYDIWNQYLDDNELPAHVIVQWAARVVYYYSHNTIGSKSLACSELFMYYVREPFVEYCCQIRTPYDINEINQMFPECKTVARLCLEFVKGIARLK